ncbi:MAG: hypothetical protein JNM31_00795 [Flavobacteriales bacterium]|nr:hypothetical protein [Flavobacteriales bacterium]
MKGFDEIDDYLRSKVKNAVQSELLAACSSALGMAVDAYVGDAAYGPLKMRVWDNLFMQTVLVDDPALRTELARTLRVMHLLERLVANDTALNTGVGIWEAYCATVILPENLFPLEDIVNEAAEPETPVPVEDPVVVAARTELARYRTAYAEVQRFYGVQMYEERMLRHEEYLGDHEGASPLDAKVEHPPLVLKASEADKLSAPTKSVLNDLKVGGSLEHVYMPYLHERFQSEIRRLGLLANPKGRTEVVVRVGGSLLRVGNECAIISQASPCDPYTGTSLPSGHGHVRPLGVADLKVVRSQLLKYELGEVAHVENVLKGEVKKRTFRNLDRT